MLIFNYTSKKELKEHVGKHLEYQETSMYGNEYPSNGTGVLVGSNRPTITGIKGREFFAQVTIKDHVITKVS